MDQNKREIIEVKTQKETLQLQLKQLETVADKQLNIRKNLDKQNKRLNDELNFIKSKHQTKCDITDMYQTQDINEINKQIEDEVRSNLERNKTKIIDPYLQNLNKKYEII